MKGDYQFMRLTPEADFVTLTPKERWKQEHHVKRWVRRHGRPYPFVSGVLKTIKGFIFTEAQPLPSAPRLRP